MRDLESFLSEEALARPRKLVSDFADAHEIRGAEMTLICAGRIVSRTVGLHTAGGG